jgi:glycosyltransferase involved in cell wall biosynthesis
VKRLVGREPRGVPRGLIRAFSGFGWQYARRARAARTRAEQTAVYLWAGKTFCDLVLKKGIEGMEGIYTFNSAGLEIMRSALRKGIRTVMEQTIAPREMEERLVTEERDRFPGWEEGPEKDDRLAEYCERERAEWEEAGLVLCGSEFVREGVASCGGPRERCVVVPYGVGETFQVPERRVSGGRLRVLTVGAVGLRKGSPYVLEAAKRMAGRAVFRMVGSVGGSAKIQQDLRRHVEVWGPVPRMEIMEQYAWADVFLLPSVCEGSATVTYEALGCGIPVICTPNAGSVVRDGRDGYVVPPRDASAIVERLDILGSRPARLIEMGKEARERAAEFTLNHYKDRLLAALKGAYGFRCGTHS